MIRINIQFPFDKYGGGGNQFLKALRKCLKEQNLYEESPLKASVILFNSHHNFNEIFSLERKFPKKIFIHRIDGPIYLVRGKDRNLDKVICNFNRLAADGIIFQSNWCRKQNKQNTGISSPYETIIYNAPDNEIFNRIGKTIFGSTKKIKLISNSNSANWRKGFDIYKFLDRHLNFNKYEMAFVGNSPVGFKNIKWIKPISSEKLAELLKEHDVYITASQNDPCSNSLIEALSCGLPAVALNDGGHPELVQKGGALFNGKEDVIEKIEKVIGNYDYYQSQIPEFSSRDVAQKYYQFAEKIYKDTQKGKYIPKQVNSSTKIGFYRIGFMILERKALNKFRAIKEKL